MKLSAPTRPVFWVSVVLAIVAVIASIVTIPFATEYGFWILLAGFIVLVFGNATTGA